MNYTNSLFYTQPLKYLFHGCIARQEIIDYVDFMFKPNKFFKFKIRNKLATKLFQRLSFERISLNRITAIWIKRTGSYYFVHLYYLSRRWRKYNTVIMFN